MKNKQEIEDMLEISIKHKNQEIYGNTRDINNGVIQALKWVLEEVK